MKRLLRIAVATLLCISAACTYAKAHNYDLPHICESGSNLSPFEISQKANFEMTVIPVAKQVMKEAGALAGSLGIGYAGRIILVCAVGYADWNSAELLAANTNPTKLEPNMLMRVLSLSKIITRIEIYKLCQSGKLDCSANAMVASGIVPYKNIAQPWHAQCRISDLAGDPYTRCDIPFGLETEDKTIAAQTGWALPLSFDQRLAWDTTSNVPHGAGNPVSNLAYMVLGRIIERTTELNYYEAARRDILRPLGIADADMIEALGAAQLKDSTGSVIRGNGPGEVWPDSRQDDDSLDIRKSEYDGRTLVRGAHAARLENFQATGAWVGTTKAWLTIGMYYNVNGVPFNTNPAFVGEVQNGEFTGTSSILKQSATSWAVYANFNRYENLSDGPPAYAASSRITNTVLTNLNGASFTYDLAKVSSAATQQVCTYRNVDSKGVSRYFPADPVAIQLFDANPSYGWTRTGDCWNMWSVGAVGTQALWRYYCPTCISHVFVTTDDATTLQMTYPNAEGYNWAVRFDAKTLATKPLNATGGCDVGTIPIYRLFRSANPNHLFTSRADWNQKPPDADFKSEGAVFCGAS